jgi:hypothetical protein
VISPCAPMRSGGVPAITHHRANNAFGRRISASALVLHPSEQNRDGRPPRRPGIRDLPPTLDALLNLKFHVSQALSRF